MSNRVIVNPLIEENMEYMADGEMAISQITGHVTIKKNNFYISKTKEQDVEARAYGSLMKSIEDLTKGKYYNNTSYNRYSAIVIEHDKFFENKSKLLNSIVNLKKLTDNYNTVNKNVLNSLRNIQLSDIEQTEGHSDIINSYYSTAIDSLMKALVQYYFSLKINATSNYFNLFKPITTSGEFKCNIYLTEHSDSKYRTLSEFTTLMNSRMNNYVWKTTYNALYEAFNNARKNIVFNYQYDNTNGGSETHIKITGKHVNFKENKYFN